MFAEHKQRILEDLVEVHQFRVTLRLPREFEQAFHNVPASLGLADDLLEVFPVGVVIAHVFDGEAGQRQDAAQRIIDFMRHAGGQHTERSQPLRLRHPGLHGHQFLGALPHFFLQRPAPFLEVAPHLAEALEHGVEGLRQQGDLSGGIGMDLLVEPAGDDVVSGGHHLADGAGDVANHVVSDADDQEKGARGNTEEREHHAVPDGGVGVLQNPDGEHADHVPGIVANWIVLADEPVLHDERPASPGLASFQDGGDDVGRCSRPGCPAAGSGSDAGRDSKFVLEDGDGAAIHVPEPVAAKQEVPDAVHNAEIPG